ncbi:putative FRG domain protein [Vibrio nigripulchritudo SFn27]|uniref:Putative FRG domain protein n=1 Tax=Vibrio nigripulchritudo TaxID=28173 RepID=U4K504_9VIBR|nr:FRG domain-containing protein [Vibrio nigripulchritudo]CCN84524.1 putative FRG domain protein [Vibrio nigripulchritudo BLFn1]CCN88846.1 putative FRG domain protein [Vibrio nigripulchritudo SFn27]CCN94334.1 putative FRG domain protein [Vibrio nigripulchritudo ENn2]CCO40181.1 putative FRG domain protein [Vibrio nigripulchritudo SFn135]CCO51518.1 putative FRG domain protein [Vibrio nigripulchritudo Wn13]
MEIIEINGAKRFLNKIGLDNPQFESPFDKYIFRGQADSKWEVTPSAFRDTPKLFNDNGLLKKIGKRTNRDQVEAEFHTLNAFIDELNRNGFHVPNEELINIDSYGVSYNDFVTRIGRGEAIWPPKDYHSIIAIAQHYGMPTRFVDWTYDPLVAAYFAAKGALDNQSSDYFSVYAVSVRNSDVRDYDFSPLKSNSELYNSYEKNKIYQLVKSPSSFNLNLKSQKGLFLAYVEKSFYSNEKFKPYSLEDFLGRRRRGRGSYKFITRTENAEELLSLLHKRFYSASTLFPSIEGCVSSVYETRRYLNK